MTTLAVGQRLRDQAAPAAATARLAVPALRAGLHPVPVVVRHLVRVRQDRLPVRVQVHVDLAAAHLPAVLHHRLAVRAAVLLHLVAVAVLGAVRPAVAGAQAQVRHHGQAAAQVLAPAVVLLLAPAAVRGAALLPVAGVQALVAVVEVQARLHLAGARLLPVLHLAGALQAVRAAVHPRRVLQGARVRPVLRVGRRQALHLGRRALVHQAVAPLVHRHLGRRVPAAAVRQSLRQAVLRHRGAVVHRLLLVRGVPVRLAVRLHLGLLARPVVR